jgi:hypothetical protein
MLTPKVTAEIRLRELLLQRKKIRNAHLEAGSGSALIKLCPILSGIEAGIVDLISFCRRFCPESKIQKRLREKLEKQRLVSRTELSLTVLQRDSLYKVYARSENKDELINTCPALKRIRARINELIEKCWRLRIQIENKNFKTPEPC